MGGPALLEKQKQKPVSVQLINEQEKKKAVEIATQIRKLETAFGAPLQKMLEQKRALIGFPTKPGRPGLTDAELLAHLMTYHPEHAKQVMKYANNLLGEVDKLRKSAMNDFDIAILIINSPIDVFRSYTDITKGHAIRWKSVLESANREYGIMKAGQERTNLDYATIGQQKETTVSSWKRKAIELPGGGVSALYGQRMFVGEGGSAVTESTLRVERELERLKLESLGEGRGFVRKMNYDEFFKRLVPIIPFIDGAITDIKFLAKGGPGSKGQRVVSLVLNIGGAAFDLVLTGQIAARTGARVTGAELRLSPGAMSGGRIVFSKSERDVLDTALRELKPNEVKNLFRLAREKGGWNNLFGELATRAGEKELSGEFLRAYMLENVGKTAGKRMVWISKHGTADFFSNGLSILGKKRYQERVRAEFLNELRTGIDFNAAKDLSNLLRATKLQRTQQEAAATALFYVNTSFSRRTQSAFLELVKKRGWVKVSETVQAEYRAAKAAGTANAVDVGTRNALMKMLPEYSQAFRYAPIHRLAEFGIFNLLTPQFIEALGALAKPIWEWLTADSRAAESRRKSVEDSLLKMGEGLATESGKGVPTESGAREAFVRGVIKSAKQEGK